MITEDYVTFETAKLLKEKGFDNDVICTDWWYDEDGDLHKRGNYSYSGAPVYHKDTCCNAPTLQMAMKWLREMKGIAVIPVISSVLDNEKFLWDVKIVVAKTNDSYSQGWVYEKQEKACEAAIKYCLTELI